jgi:hypothetical protein
MTMKIKIRASLMWSQHQLQLAIKLLLFVGLKRARVACRKRTWGIFPLRLRAINLPQSCTILSMYATGSMRNGIFRNSRGAMRIWEEKCQLIKHGPCSTRVRIDKRYYVKVPCSPSWPTVILVLVCTRVWFAPPFLEQATSDWIVYKTVH